MHSIITITDAASAYLSKIIKEENAIGFRLSLKKTGCSGYSYVPKVVNEIIESDLHFIAQENLQVYVDLQHQDFLQGTIVDYIEENKSGIKQKRLVFINPKEKNRCGCGESFKTE
jgi:iron-sulfur cluster assembly protein